MCLALSSEDIIPDYYVASFSKAADDLTQWRAYGKDKGICVGFDLSLLDSHMHIYLPRKAIYTNRDKNRIIIFYINLYFQEFIKDVHFYNGCVPDFLPGRYSESLARKLEFEFVRFKHPSFQSERELRVVIAGSESGSYKTLRHRVRGNVVVPYHRTSDRILRNADGTEMEVGRLPIASVTVGPMRYQKLCVRSLRDFLRFHAYDGNLVNASEIPYQTL